MKDAARICWFAPGLFAGDRGAVGGEAAHDLDRRPAGADGASGSGTRRALGGLRLRAGARAFNLQVVDADRVLRGGGPALADVVGAAQGERKRADLGGQRNLLA